MFAIFAFLSIAASVILSLLVMIQNSKGGGLNSAFGASNITSMIGTRRATQDVEKFTWYVAGAMGVLCILATLTTPKAGVSGPDKRFTNIIEDRYAIPDQPAGQAQEGGAAEGGEEK